MCLHYAVMFLCMFEIKILWCVYLAFCQKSDIRGSRVQTGNVHDIASSNNALSSDLLRFRTVVRFHSEGGSENILGRFSSCRKIGDLTFR